MHDPMRASHNNFEALGQANTVEYTPASFCSILCRCRTKDRACCAGSVIPRIVPRACIFACTGGIITYLHWYLCGDNWGHCKYEESIFNQQTDLHTYLGLIVALMLVFRTNSSYARYDAGVEAMGKLRVNARCVVSQATAYIDGDDEGKRQRMVEHIRRLTVLYCLMFKRCVHKEDVCDALIWPENKSILAKSKILQEDELEMLQSASPTARTVLVTGWLRTTIHQSWKQGMLNESGMQLMDETVTDMVANFQKGCRISYILMPFPYAQVVKWACTVYCAISPVSYVENLRWATPLASALVAMVIFAVDEIGVEIEDPFGLDETDINLGVVMHEIDDQLAGLVSQRNNAGCQLLLKSCGHNIDVQAATAGLTPLAIHVEYEDDYDKMAQNQMLASPNNAFHLSGGIQRYHNPRHSLGLVSGSAGNYESERDIGRSTSTQY